jgi:hypothetical protein
MNILIIGSLLFLGLVIISLSMLLSGIIDNNSDLIFFIIIFLVGSSGFIFYIYMIISLKKRKKLLIIDEKGIIDNSTYAGFGFVPWNEIEKIYIDSFFGYKYIELKIKNEKKYLDKFTWWKKQVLKNNKRLFGHQPFCISFHNTKIQPENIFPQIQELFEKFEPN